MSKLSIKFIIVFMSLVLHVFANANANANANAKQNYYTVNSTNGNIVFGINDEGVSKSFADFPYSGLSEPVKALITFFNLSKNKELKAIIDMHYVPDGSRRYVKELLHSNPDSFSGSKDLDSIKIIKKYFIGEHEVLLFEIQDKSGAKAIWFEDFLCKEETCLKSYYLNIFGKGVGAKIFNQFLSIEKIKSSQPETNYKKVVLDKEYFGANNPFELYLNAKDITTDEMSEQWYLKLDKIREFEEGPDKMSLIAGYVPTIFDGWEVNKVVNFDFNTVRIDKDLLISNLYGVNDFSVYGFLDTDQIIWVYASARTYDDKFASFLFAYDKIKEKFLMKGSEIGVGRILMNRAVESKLFELNADDVTYDEYKYKAREKDGVINAFYNDLRPNIQWDWIYTIFASVLLLALVFIMALYIKRKRL